MDLIESVFAAKKHLGLFKGKKPQEAFFVPDCDLSIEKETVELMKALADTYCKKSVKAIDKKGDIKYSKGAKRHGDMIGGGWGGARVGGGVKRGYYKHTDQLQHFAKRMIEAVPEELREAIDLSLETPLYSAASFITVNFSHARDVSDHENLLHRDKQDQSSTVLLLWQDPNTPLDHQAHWVCGEKPIKSLSGGLMEIFNGRTQAHGVVPPKIYNPDYPWYGATVLKKSLAEPIEVQIKTLQSMIDSEKHHKMLRKLAETAGVDFDKLLDYDSESFDEVLEVMRLIIITKI